MSNTRQHKSRIQTVLICAVLAAEYARDTFCPERTGGYLCLQDMKSGVPLAITVVGTCDDDEKAKKYLTFCQEKACRLQNSPHDHTSYQSRNEANLQYGGAIRGSNYIFSFSGFPELVDEAAMLVGAVLAGELVSEKAHDLAELSNNPHYVALMRKIRRENSSLEMLINLERRRAFSVD